MKIKYYLKIYAILRKITINKLNNRIYLYIYLIVSINNILLKIIINVCKLNIHDLLDFHNYA